MSTYDLVIIGSGPGGEVGAIRAAQLGLKTALIEKRPYLGGTCLNVGCIPTKALLESAKTYEKLQHAADLGFNISELSYDWQKIMQRKEKIVSGQRKGLDFLMKKNKVTCYQGTGKLLGKNKVSVTKDDGSEEVIDCKNVLLATGSKIKEIASLATNGTSVINSDDILALDSIPKSLCVIGGGVVGSEFASLYARFGSAVTIVEMADQILPSEDPESVKEVARVFKKQKITLKTSSQVEKLTAKKKSATITIKNKKGESETLEFEKVLVSIGRSPCTDNIGLESLGIEKNEQSFIKVKDNYSTTIPWVYAIGDIIPTPMLAHTASAEAMHAVEVIAGHKPGALHYDSNPSAIYTSPEIASIGKSQAQLDKAKTDYQVVKFPFAPMARAKIEDATIGFIKIFYGTEYRELLGVSIVGAKATEMIAEFSLGMVLETTIDEIGLTIHPHPTLSETIMEAAHASVDGPIHM